MSVTIRTVAKTGFRWLGDGEHIGLSSAVTRRYYPSPHPSLYTMSLLRPRAGWNSRNFDCLSPAQPDSCRTPSQPLTVPGRSSRSLGETRAGKSCPWDVYKLLTCNSMTHSELPYHFKLQLPILLSVKKVNATPTVPVLHCPWRQEVYQVLNKNMALHKQSINL